MLLKRNSVNIQNENFLTNKTRTKIIIYVTSLNISRENVLKINIKTNHYYTTITAKSLR